MTTVTVMRHRLDPHNSPVSLAADAAGYCGFLHPAVAYIWLIWQRDQLSISACITSSLPGRGPPPRRD